MNIYQEIWDADMNENGVRPIFASEKGDLSQGFVAVNTESCHQDHRVIKEVSIPDRKRGSYEYVEKLFDNYTLNQTSREKNSISESKEVEEFLKMAVNSAPLRLAKKYLEENTNKVLDEIQWYTFLHRLWFRQFDWESGRDLSGFEHVFVGDQKGRKLVGHHFWYKYWLEDTPTLNEHHNGLINMTCSAQDELKYPSPDVITVSYHLKAYDYEKRRFIKVIKRKCAFFVGLSAEGLLAIGTVRAMQESNTSEFLLNDVPYKLKLFMSPDGKRIRTFYPSYEPTQY
ncbi:hypothetical protein ACFYKX_08765 [Cytobacillus sp. FJAT-54145]|uniref:EndoU domain-containing protein n=1 Tax=Cytobacillus spartinae TaxID=3299023 RepID=A0ABW6KD43_9BACI